MATKAVGVSAIPAPAPKVVLRVIHPSHRAWLRTSRAVGVVPVRVEGHSCSSLLNATVTWKHPSAQQQVLPGWQSPSVGRLRWDRPSPSAVTLAASREPPPPAAARGRRTGQGEAGFRRAGRSGRGGQSSPSVNWRGRNGVSGASAPPTSPLFDTPSVNHLASPDGEELRGWRWRDGLGRFRRRVGGRGRESAASSLSGGGSCHKSLCMCGICDAAGSGRRSAN